MLCSALPTICLSRQVVSKRTALNHQPPARRTRTIDTDRPSASICDIIYEGANDSFNWSVGISEIKIKSSSIGGIAIREDEEAEGGCSDSRVWLIVQNSLAWSTLERTQPAVVIITRIINNLALKPEVDVWRNPVVGSNNTRVELHRGSRQCSCVRRGD